MKTPHTHYVRNEPISETLTRLVSQRKKKITLDEMSIALKDRGMAILLMVFAMPSMVPLTPPGFCTVVSMPQFFIAFQIAFGFKRLWLPHWLGKREIELKSLRYVVKKFMPFLLWLEKLIRPRLYYMSSRFTLLWIGWLSVLCAFSVLLPIPFTNTVPSFGIFFMMLGLLERDGWMIKAGVLISAGGLALSTIMVFFGVEILKFVWEFLLSVF